MINNNNDSEKSDDYENVTQIDLDLLDYKIPGLFEILLLVNILYIEYKNLILIS